MSRPKASMVTVTGEETVLALSTGAEKSFKRGKWHRGRSVEASSPRRQLSQEEYGSVVGRISERLALFRVGCLFRSMLGVGGKRSLDQETQGNV